MPESGETCHQCGAQLRFVCTRVADEGIAECYRCTECDAGGHRTEAGSFGPAFETQRSAARVTDGPEIEERPRTDGGHPIEEPTVSLDLDTAETLLEAAGTVRDDIASGRQWGFDEDTAQDNATDLNEAFHELRNKLEEASP